MGCSNGKMVKVSPSGEVVQIQSSNMKTLDSSGKLAQSTSSLNSAGDRPSKSATSKGSKHSQDSGYSGNNLEDDDGFDEYEHIITENSDGAVVENIERTFHAPDLDFCLSGTPAPRNLSAKDKARLDEQRILENLRNEGLIATSKFEAKSGLAFEVVEASTMPRRTLPARLAKLDTKKKKKKTKEEIAEKLVRAERRRKEAENERLEKINSVTTKSDISHVQEGQEKLQQELRENTIKKVDSVSEKRDQKLQEVKDKLRAREEHAAKVRLRKKLHIPTQEEMDQYEATANIGSSDTQPQVLPTDIQQCPIDNSDNVTDVAIASTV